MKLTILIISIAALFTALYYAGCYIEKQPSKLEVCRAMVLKEVAKNQQFVDAVATPDFLTAMTRSK